MFLIFIPLLNFPPKNTFTIFHSTLILDPFLLYYPDILLEAHEFTTDVQVENSCATHVTMRENEFPGAGTKHRSCRDFDGCLKAELGNKGLFVSLSATSTSMGTHPKIMYLSSDMAGPAILNMGRGLQDLLQPSNASDKAGGANEEENAKFAKLLETDPRGVSFVI